MKAANRQDDEIDNAVSFLGVPMLTAKIDS